MKQFASSLLIAIICLFGLRCSTTQENANPIFIAPTVNSSTTSKIKIVNNSSSAIYYLYVAKSTDTSWGDDQLGDSIIAAGSSFTINNIPIGTYDFSAQTSGYLQATTLVSVSLTAGQTYVWTITDNSFSSSGKIKIVNNSDYDIYYLNVADYRDTSWGDDQLGDSIIAAGSSFTLNNIEADDYDLRAQTIGYSQTTTFTDISLTAGQTYVWTITDNSFPAPAYFKVVNFSSSATTIDYLYNRLSGDTTWGPDMLGRYTSIAYDYSFTRYMTPSVYDFKVVSSKGDSATTFSDTLFAGYTTTWTIDALGKRIARSIQPNRIPTLLPEKNGALISLNVAQVL